MCTCCLGLPIFSDAGSGKERSLWMRDLCEAIAFPLYNPVLKLFSFIRQEATCLFDYKNFANLKRNMEEIGLEIETETG